MSRKVFSVLVLTLTAVVAAIFLLLPAPTARDGIGTQDELLPGLAERVNELDRFTVVGAGETVIATLIRSDDAWTVTELADYPANLDTVRTVLAGLAQAQIIEQKTSNPEFYTRLGVEDLSQADAAGLRMDLSAGEQQWSLIIGKEAANRGGFYLREARSAGSVLADFDENVPKNAAGWVNSRIVDIMAGEVAEVRVVHPDGETITARKTSADETDFTLLELPQGRELVSAWSVNSLGSALSTLNFDSVMPRDSFEQDFGEALQLSTVTFDGMQLDAWLLRDEDGDWLRLEASAPFTVTDTDADAADEANEKLMTRVSTINERVAGWVYQIPAAKAETIDKRLDDLLRETAASGQS